MSDIPEREVGPGTPPSTAARTVPYIPAPSRPSPPAPMPSIPGYELRDVLGSGGMGIVYRAVQVALNREVALKVIKPEYLTDPQAVARFKQELRAAAQLTSHPNVVMVYDAGPEGPLHYFSMELVPGIDEIGSAKVHQALPTE